jgi:hypothetical protein
MRLNVADESGAVADIDLLGPSTLPCSDPSTSIAPALTLARTFPLAAIVRSWPVTSMLPFTSPSMVRGSLQYIAPVTLTDSARTARDADVSVPNEVAADTIAPAFLGLAVILLSAKL